VAAAVAAERGGKMKILWAVIASVFVLAGTVSAQDFSETVRQALDEMQDRKKANVDSLIELDEDRMAEFRDVYEEYQEALQKENERYIEIAWQYLDRSGEMTDERAKKLVGEYLDLEESRVKLRSEYMKKFGEILPPVQLVHLFQLENKAEAAFKHDIATHIPLME